jgi:thiamine-monophosphate kinase
VGERELIHLLRAWFGPVAPPSPLGIGDDCAVLPPPPPGRNQLLTTDSLTYGQHFDATARPEQAGAKLMNRNLSDIAAMGGVPAHALLNLLAGPDLSMDWLEQFVRGMRRSCERYGVLVVGGDISQLEAGHFTASVTLTGYTGGSPVLRSTAGTGDAIYVTGRLGGSILQKHLRFEPRIKEGQWLAAQKACTAMMDLTDGLGKDLAAILPEGTSAAIDLGALPLSDDARKRAAKDGLSPEAHAFCDGEDYELLFTVGNEAKLGDFEAAWRTSFPDLVLSRIGEIVKARPAGRYIDAKTREALTWQSGFEHFKRG